MRNSGFVLVTVLWILAILTVVALGFGHRAMMERQTAWFALDQQQAMGAARGAVERGILSLYNRPFVDEYFNQQPYTSLNQQWAQPVDLFREGTYFADAEDDAFSKDRCALSIYDCDGRIAINDAPEELIRNVKVLGRDAVRKILDYRDPGDRDTAPRRFVSLDEVQAIAEIPDSLWYGEGLRELFTVWSGDYRGLINVNTATPEVLRTLPGVDSEVVDAIVAYRDGDDALPGTRDDRPFANVRDIAATLRLSAERLQGVVRQCKTESTCYSVEARATRRRGKVNAYCTATVMYSRPIQILDWREGYLGSQ